MTAWGRSSATTSVGFVMDRGTGFRVAAQPNEEQALSSQGVRVLIDGEAIKNPKPATPGFGFFCFLSGLSGGETAAEVHPLPLDRSPRNP